MKQTVKAVLIGLGVVAVAGCAELQQQAGAFLPQQNQPQQNSLEGGQQVKTIGGTGGAASSGSIQQGVADEGSSLVGDLVKEAGSTAKSQISGSIRSAIRGAFSN
ncbi:hypothetical protein [Pseudomonas lurida]|uniref:hypothetical protein n=1 Tax=Pseudomonas lurida TaxID=244566 RepID=UPI0011457B83|nr:hypothetical protein [Pseudomonas lurida]